MDWALPPELLKKAYASLNLDVEEAKVGDFEFLWYLNVLPLLLPEVERDPSRHHAIFYSCSSASCSATNPASRIACPNSGHPAAHAKWWRCGSNVRVGF